MAESSQQPELIDRLRRVAEKTAQLTRKRWLRICVQVVILLCCLMYLVTNLQDARDLITDLRIDYSLIIAAWSLTTVAVFLGALAWWLTLLGLGQEVSWFSSTRIHLFSNLAKYAPGYAWQLMGKAYLTRQVGPSLRAVGLGMALELVQLVWTGVGVAISLVPTTLVLEYTGQQVTISHLRLAGLATFLFLAAFIFAVPLALRKMSYYRAAGQMKPLALLGATMVMTVGWLLFGFSFWLLGTALEPLPLSKVPLFVFALVASLLAGLAAVIVPNGIGVRESVMVLILGAHMPGSLAVILAGLARLVVTLGEFAGALVAKALFRWMEDEGQLTSDTNSEQR